MKLFVLFLALIAFTGAQPVRKSDAEIDQIRTACEKRSNVPEELVEKSRHSDVPPIEVFEVGLCIFRGLDFWSDSTGFNVNNIMEMIPQGARNRKKLSETLENCLDAKREGDTPLSWAFRNFRCFDILMARRGEHSME